LDTAPQNALAAYADDVNILVTRPADIQVVEELLGKNENANGACLNIRKSKVLAVGAWDMKINILGIPCHQEMTILGFRFTNTIVR
jgi:hypothetical protein